MPTPTNTLIGLGSQNASINVYIENRPPLPEYESLNSFKPLNPHDISTIATLTGNHWRKIFNVYAKLVHELHSKNYNTWQTLRDDYLLQENSDQRLIFSKLTVDEISPSSPTYQSKNIHIVMGKTYAKKLGVDTSCYWLSESFAINEAKKLIVCPYFDYRQLSNIKITQLVQLIKQLQKDDLKN